MTKNGRKKKIKARRTQTDLPTFLTESEKSKSNGLPLRKSNSILEQLLSRSSFQSLKHQRFDFKKPLTKKSIQKITILKSQLNIDDDETFLDDEKSTLSKSSTETSDSDDSDSLSIRIFPDKDMNVGTVSTEKGNNKMADKTSAKRPKRPSTGIANSNIYTNTNMNKITKANIKKQSFYILKLPFGAKVEMKDGHIVLIDYKKMDRKKIRSIQEFCCYNSILPILALIIFTLWHSVFYNHLTDLDRQTIEFWFTDLEKVMKKSNSVISIMNHNNRSILAHTIVDQFDTWIIVLVCVTIFIFALGIIAFCYHNHYVMMFYRNAIIPFLIILVIFLIVSIIFGIIFWSRINNGNSMNFLKKNYDQFPGLHMYMHHTHQWFQCCDWIKDKDNGHNHQNYNATVSSSSDMVPVSCCQRIISYDHTEQSMQAFLDAVPNKWCLSKQIDPSFRRSCAKHPAIITMIVLLIIAQVVLISDTIRLCAISEVF